MNDELVKKYINGEDTEGYNLNELENDPKFMTKVLEISKDPKMFLFASESAKKDPTLIETTMKSWKGYYGTLPFEVYKAYLSYLKDNKKDRNSLEYKEFIVKLDDEEFEYMSNRKDPFFNGEAADEDKGLIYTICDDYNKLRNEMIDGNFDDLLKKYGKSNIIIKKIIDIQLNLLFTGDDEYSYDHIEDYLHYAYKYCKKAPVKHEADVDITKFVIEFVRKNDAPLAFYLEKHQEYLKDVKKEVKEAIENWEDYYDNVDFYSDIDDKNLNNVIQVCVEKNGNPFPYGFDPDSYLDFMVLGSGVHYKVYDYGYIDYEFTPDTEYFKGEFSRERKLLSAAGLSYIANLDAVEEKEFINSGTLKENPVEGAYKRALEYIKKEKLNVYEGGKTYENGKLYDLMYPKLEAKDNRQKNYK